MKIRAIFTAADGAPVLNETTDDFATVGDAAQRVADGFSMPEGNIVWHSAGGARVVINLRNIATVTLTAEPAGCGT